VSPEHERWLAGRAAGGDERALELLLEACRRQLINVCMTWADSTADSEIDDLYAIVAARVWAEVQRGHYNPHRAPFAAFATYAAREVLRDHWQRRRALKRWTGSPPASLDHLAELGWDPPSWSLGADPLRVVLARETFREAIDVLTQGQLAAVRAYQRNDEGQPTNVVTAFYDARKRVRPLLLDALT
jgi:DNA-directed RNA polymerase specialized sigma24 family protein